MMVTPSETAIVTDSTADIPPQLASRYHIEVVPAVLTINGQSYQDGRDFNRRALYESMDGMQHLPTTATPAAGVFETTYRRLLKMGAKNIISIHVSSKLSGMLNAVHQAAGAIGSCVHPIDSGQVSLGLGFQAIELAQLAQEGAALDHLLQLADSLRKRVRTIAGIDSLQFLRRSGRVSWLRAEIGLRLRLRLVLEVIDGDVVRHSIARTRRQVMTKLLQEAHTWQPLRRLAILHSGIPSLAEELLDRLSSAAQVAPFMVDVTTVIGAHVGPRSIGLAGLLP